MYINTTQNFRDRGNWETTTNKRACTHEANIRNNNISILVKCTILAFNYFNIILQILSKDHGFTELTLCVLTKQFAGCFAVQYKNVLRHVKNELNADKKMAGQWAQLTVSVGNVSDAQPVSATRMMEAARAEGQKNQFVMGEQINVRETL